MALTRATKDMLIEAVRRAAREEIMPRFRHLGAGDIATKTHADDLVTVADTRAELHMRRTLAITWPEAAVVGEEGVSQDPTEIDKVAAPGPTVILDPVDGTWNFARGLTTFGTILAVIEDDVPTYGLLYDPVMDDWIEASKGEGTQFFSRGTTVPITLSPAPPLDRITGIHTEYNLTDAQWTASLDVHRALGRIKNFSASLWDYRTILTGGAGFAMNAHLNVWDHAAGVLAITEAGGHAALLDGTPYHPSMQAGYLLVAQSPALWDDLAARFSPALLR